MSETIYLSAADVVAREVKTADFHHHYGVGEHQFANLYLPEGAGPHPVTIAVHGGCWRAGYSLDHLSGFCRALAAAGTAVWSLEYRRIGHEGRGWQDTFLDVAAGADGLRDVAERFNLDLSRVVVTGHSAGGHLACWLAARGRLPADSPLFVADPLPLRGVVALAGIPDLARALETAVCGDAAAKLLLAEPDDAPERYGAGSPVRLLPFGVPQHHLVGEGDAIVPPSYLEPYVAAARAAGDAATLTVLPEAAHFELIVPETAAFEVVKTEILRLIAF